MFRSSASLFRASGEQTSHLVARVGVELGEVRQRDDRGDGDNSHEHRGEHEARAVVRPPRVLREETRAHVRSWRRVLSFAARIVFSGPRLARARRERFAGRGGRGGHASGRPRRARARVPRSVDACRAGGNAEAAGGSPDAFDTDSARRRNKSVDGRTSNFGSYTRLHTFRRIQDLETKKATVDKAHSSFWRSAPPPHTPQHAPFRW